MNRSDCNSLIRRRPNSIARPVWPVLLHCSFIQSLIMSSHRKDPRRIRSLPPLLLVVVRHFLPGPRLRTGESKRTLEPGPRRAKVREHFRHSPVQRSILKQLSIRCSIGSYNSADFAFNVSSPADCFSRSTHITGHHRVVSLHVYRREKKSPLVPRLILC